MQVNVVIISVTVITDNRMARNPGDRRGEAVVKMEFESSGIERIKVRVQGGVAL